MSRATVRRAASSVLSVLPAALVAGTLLLVWEVLVRTGVISSFLFPAPTRVVATLVSESAHGDLLEHLAATLMRVVPGLIAGAVPGLLLGLAMGWSRRTRQLFDPLVSAVHPVPKITLLPLFMVIFGIGETTGILLVAVAAFFPMLINAMAGVRQISPLYLEVAENYGAGRLRIFLDVILPGSLPMVLSGLRLAANVALVVTIALEIITAGTGLGALVWLSWELLRTELLYATILVVALLGIVLRLLLELLERTMVPWHRGVGDAV